MRSLGFDGPKPRHVAASTVCDALRFGYCWKTASATDVDQYQEPPESTESGGAAAALGAAPRITASARRKNLGAHRPTTSI